MTSPAMLVLGGRYHLVERIAVGGMGEVWRAEDQVLGRDVAVKVLREEYAHDPTFRRRFRAEAQHAAVLVHPNVAQVFDFGDGDDERGDPPYLVMELIRGEPLSVILDREAPLGPARTWSIVGQTASALAAAHAAGVVHRDVKPANLLVCADGTVKVTDFGIARATGSAAVTMTGMILGTPHYVSPEQVIGEPATAASDFYALGALAYECLTGRRLFDGEPMSVLIAHREQPPPALPPGVPAGLRDLVMAMLDKDPTQRPVDGRAIAAQAERFNAPTVSMPVLPAPASTPAPAAGDAPTGVLAAPEPAAAGDASPGGAAARGGRTPVASPSASAGATSATLASAAAGSARGHRRWGWAVGAAALVAAAVAGVLVAVLGTGGGSSGSHAKAAAKGPSLVPVQVARVSPYGSSDHPEEAPFATDGHISTAWYTQHYATASFGGLRSGTGLLFDLGRAVKVRSLTLRLAVSGVAVQIRAGDAADQLAGAATVGTSSSAPGTLTLHPNRSARYWLVWFTRLAPNDGAYRAGVAEATFAR